MGVGVAAVRNSENDSFGLTGIASIGPIAAVLLYGILFGILFAYGAKLIFKKTKLLTDGTDTIFMVAIALISFAVPDLIGGNGFLSVYVTGIILGNSEIKNKINMIHFFDGITALFQVLIFFLIGFLSLPHKIPQSFSVAIAIMLFLTFIARPTATALIMLPFKAKMNQIMLVSSAGLRGAASIVFAILVVAQSESFACDLFHIVFIIVLLSVTLQGSLLPYLSKKLSMIDRFNDVRKTFNDYQQESAIALNKLTINENHPWNNLKIKDINLSEGALILTIKRENENIIPNGSTQLQLNDELLIGTTYQNVVQDIKLIETNIDKNHEWNNKKLSQIHCPKEILIALIKREGKFFVPNGETKIELNDTIIFHRAK